MAMIIKVKCNGPKKHVNEVDLEKALRKSTAVLAFGTDAVNADEIPERIVLDCRECTDGKVVIDRATIAAELKRRGGEE